MRRWLSDDQVLVEQASAVEPEAHAGGVALSVELLIDRLVVFSSYSELSDCDGIFSR